MGKGLPKKYAKMGFKKGWAAYKRAKSGRRRAAPRKKSVTRRKRRAYASPKRRVRRVARRRRKMSRSTKKRIGLAVAIPVGIIGAAAAKPVLDGIFSETGSMSDLGTNLQTGLNAAAGAVAPALVAAVGLGVMKMFVGGGSFDIGKYRVGL